ncbi:MAG: DUF2789 family protein [Rhodocyclaceae bacterium]|nr:MAG: DUF2789 family protein [Rhodocyclaceae bacterium]
MRGNVNTMSDLFKQLGLPSDNAAIEDFIARHEGVCTHCTLPHAPIWSESQRAFLEQAVADDSDWALPAEELAGMLGH